MSLFRTLFGSLRQRPATLGTAALTLGLGLGALTTGYAFVDALLLRPLPYPEPDHLVAVFETAPDQPRRAVAPANFLDWRASLGEVAELTAYHTSVRTLRAAAGSERVRASSVSANFFTMLGGSAAVGRTLLPFDDRIAGSNQVVLADATWRELYGADPAIVGGTVQLDEIPHEVVGIMPASFHPPESVGLWVLGDRGVPALPGFGPDLVTQRDIHYFRVVARLAPATTADAFQRRMEAIGHQLETEHPATNRGLGAGTMPLRTAITGDHRTSILILLGAVALVLLISTANTTNLLVAATAARRQEFAVRTALGASRRDLVLQVVGEGLVMAGAAGALGCALAIVAVARISAGNPLALPTATPVAVDLRVLAAGLGSALLVGTAANLIAALRATKPSALASLRGGRGVAGGGSGRLVGGLAVLQLATSLTLLTGAGLLIKGYHILTQNDPGFRPDRLVVVDVAPSQTSYPTDHDVRGYFDQVLGAAGAQPGVEVVSAIANLPTGGGSMNRGFRIEGRPDPERPGDQTIEYQSTDAAYFGTMGIPILAGRGLTRS